MNEFHFLRPYWLLALLPLAFLLWRLARRRAQGGAWRAAVDPELLGFLLEGEGGSTSKAPRLRLIAIALGGLIGALALAGPAWERLPQPLFQQTAPLVIALDLSTSMEAADPAPSRITRARHKLLDILAHRREGLTALVVYAGAAFAITPLTDDAAAIRAHVDALGTDLLPAQGSDPAAAARKAVELLTQSGITRGDLLFITDGLGEAAPETISNALPEGVRVSVLGIGSTIGAPIPQKGGGFIKDAQGAIVVSRLEAEPLQRLARLRGGRYAELTTDDADIEALLAPLTAERPDDTQRRERQNERWLDRGPWLLPGLILLAALGFRRGVLALATLALLPLLALGPAGPAEALEGADLWRTPDQQGQQLLEAGQAEAAAGRLANPEWRAEARFRAGQFDQALADLEGVEGGRAAYNRGNALARLGRLPEAKAAYDQALKADPNHADARHNRELVEQALAAQQPPPQQGQQGQGDGQEKGEPQGDSGQKEGKGEQNKEKKGQEAGQTGMAGQDGQADQQDPVGMEGKSRKDGAEEPGRQPKPEAPKPQDKAAAKPDKGLAKDPGATGDPAKDQAASPGAKASSEGQASGEKDKAVAAEAAVDPAHNPPSEGDQATENLLRLVPDDPGAFLRRKFEYQYRQGEVSARPGARPW